MKKLLILCPFLLISSVESATYLVKIKDVTKTNIIKTEEYRNWNSSSSTFTEWLNFNAAYNMSLYNPKIVDQVEDFIQTQTFKQDQQQFEQKREYDTVKKVYKNIGDPIETQQTLSLENTKEVTVIANDWLSVGVPKDCATWNPDVYSVVYGEEFTQSRQCSQDKNRTIEYYIDLSLDSTLLFDQTFLLIENKQAFGSNASTGWTPHTSTYSEWINSGSAYAHGTYSPTPSTQTSNFNQSRSYYQKQVNNEQPREINTFTNSIRNNGSVIEKEQILTENETRTVSVTYTSWTAVRTNYGCGSYSPDIDDIPDGDRFLQTRNCYTDSERVFYYKDGSTLLHTRTQYKTNNSGTSRYRYGTKDVSIAATWGCPSGWKTSTNSDRCFTSAIETPSGIACPSGYVRSLGNVYCANYINMSYSCPSGYSLSGNRCNP